MKRPSDSIGPCAQTVIDRILLDKIMRAGEMVPPWLSRRFWGRRLDMADFLDILAAKPPAVEDVELEPYIHYRPPRTINTCVVRPPTISEPRASASQNSDSRESRIWGKHYVDADYARGVRLLVN